MLLMSVARIISIQRGALWRAESVTFVSVKCSQEPRFYIDVVNSGEPIPQTENDFEPFSGKPPAKRGGKGRLGAKVSPGLYDRRMRERSVDDKAQEEVCFRISLPLPASDKHYVI